jgi:serine phosphatase RsbU (regulator of sigma subunit)
MVSEELSGNSPAALLSESSSLAAASIQTSIQEDAQRKLAEMQREMDVLRGEVNILRRRDETLHFYMQRLDDELRLAARLQQDFLPKTLPQLGKVRFHTLFRPAGYVSGDLYDVMRLDERHVGFYIADAVGHGMPAALLTMFIKHALVTKEIIPGGYRLLKPSEAMGRLNSALVEQNLANATFATALYGLINVHTLEMTMACAGHPMPVLLRGEEPMLDIPTHGGLLGVFPEETYTDFTTRLNPGDRVMIYTDGVEVAFCNDPSTGDPDRWRQELVNRRSLPTEALLTDFAECADKESGSLEPKDDLTVILMEVESA